MANPISSPAPAPADPEKEQYIAKVRKAGDAYKASMLEAYRYEAEYFGLTGNNPPKVAKPAQAQTGLVTDDVIKTLRELMAQYPSGAKGGEFNVILGRCGIVGVKQTGDARTELATKGIIEVVELGSGSGRGNPKIIKLVEAGTKG